MKRKDIYTIIAAWLTAVLSASCEIETSDNGDLDGFWHLERVDTIRTGGRVDLKDEYVFWAVQKDLLNACDRHGDRGDFLFRFEHKGKSLRLYDPHVNDRMNGDPAVDDAGMLRPFGVNALDETFGVERLTGSKMVLSTEELRLSFTKL